MKQPESLLEILQHHINGGSFRYKSYDHKPAEAEFKAGPDYASNLASMTFYDKNIKEYHVGKHEIPLEIREKYSIWRRGKLRKVEFNNIGGISRLYIGSKFAIPVYQRDLSIIQLIND